MGDFAEKYKPKGLQVFRVAAYDDELTALEFERHYRLNGKVTTLLDPDRKFEKRYNRRGWPYCILTGAKGTIVYSDHSLVSEKKKPFYDCLDAVLGEDSVLKNKVLNNALPPKGAIELFPSIAISSSGDVHLVFTRLLNGNGDIIYRHYDSKSNKWSKDIAIAESAADEWDGTVIVDDKGPLVSYVSNHNTNGQRYEVFLRRPGQKVPEQMTQSPDDAMHPRLCVDGQGTLWLTYYQWHFMRGNSRDKEVYLRFYKEGKWSEGLKVSPNDVPTYEDHTEPFVIPQKKGVKVLWAWDFHRPKGYDFKAHCPTIFMRDVTDDKEMSPIKLMSMGSTNGAARGILSAQGKVWNIFTDSSNCQELQSVCEGAMDKPLFTGKLDEGRQICSPNLIAAPENRLVAIWAHYPQHTKQGKWTIRWSKRTMDQKGEWSKPREFSLPEDSRFPVAKLKGEKLWLAFVDGEKKVQVKMLPFSFRNLPE